MCFEMAGSVSSNGSARSLTVASPSARRARIARRVGLASAAKVSLEPVLVDAEAHDATSYFPESANKPIWKVTGSWPSTASARSRGLDVAALTVRLHFSSISTQILLKQKASAGLMDPVMLFERAATNAASHGRAGDARTSAAAPTPCAEWDVDALLAHMVGGPGYLLGALGLDRTRAAGGQPPYRTRRGGSLCRGAPAAGCARRSVHVAGGLRVVDRGGDGGHARWTSSSTRGISRSRSARTVDSIPSSSRRASRCSCRRCPRSAAPPASSDPKFAVPDGRVRAGPAARRDGPATLTGDASLDDAVRAMGHPGRRAMLRLARDEERTASELAEVAGLSPSAASPHLKLLRETGLMHVRVDAKRRLYRVDLATAGRGSRRAWTNCGVTVLDALKTHAEADSDRRASEATVGVKLVEQRLFIDAPPGARVRAADRRCAARRMDGARRMCATRARAARSSWTHVNGDSRRRCVRRAGAGPAHRVHLRLGPRRRRDPHPDRRPSRSTCGHATAAPSSTSCTAASPARWPTRTPAVGPTTWHASPPSPKAETPAPTHSPTERVPTAPRARLT